MYLLQGEKIELLQELLDLASLMKAHQCNTHRFPLFKSAALSALDCEDFISVFVLQAIEGGVYHAILEAQSVFASLAKTFKTTLGSFNAWCQACLVFVTLCRQICCL